MRKTIKTILTALSLTLLASQALASDLQSHPSEANGNPRYGLIAGTVTKVEDSSGWLYSSYSATVSFAGIEKEYLLESKDLYDKLKQVAESDNKSVMVHYVTTTFSGDAMRLRLPSHIPNIFYSYSDSVTAGNKFKLIDIASPVPFEGSASAKQYNTAPAQNEKITLKEGETLFTASGRVASVERDSDTHGMWESMKGLVKKNRQCFLTVVGQEEADKKEATVSVFVTDQEEVCAYGESAALASKPITIKYKAEGSASQPPTAVIIQPEGTPENVEPLALDGKPISAVLPAQPRPFDVKKALVDSDELINHGIIPVVEKAAEVAKTMAGKVAETVTAPFSSQETTTTDEQQVAQEQARLAQEKAERLERERQAAAQAEAERLERERQAAEARARQPQPKAKKKKQRDW